MCEQVATSRTRTQSRRRRAIADVADPERAARPRAQGDRGLYGRDPAARRRTCRTPPSSSSARSSPRRRAVLRLIKQAGGDREQAAAQLRVRTAARPQGRCVELLHGLEQCRDRRRTSRRSRSSRRARCVRCSPRSSPTTRSTSSCSAARCGLEPLPGCRSSPAANRTAMDDADDSDAATARVTGADRGRADSPADCGLGRGSPPLPGARGRGPASPRATASCWSSCSRPSCSRSRVYEAGDRARDCCRRSRPHRSPRRSSQERAHVQRADARARAARRARCRRASRREREPSTRSCRRAGAGTASRRSRTEHDCVSLLLEVEAVVRGGLLSRRCRS